MKKLRIISLILTALLLVSILSACGGEMFGYRVLTTVGSEKLALAFRQGDPISVLVPAALRELKNSGRVSELSVRWFGEDLTLIPAEADAVKNALAELGLKAVPAREFILGVDSTAAPYSFASDKGIEGFDVDLAQAVCSLLGYKLKIQPISAQKAETELLAGNIDCAWGGMSFPATGDKITVTEPYFSTSHLLLVKSDSGVRRAKGLGGKIICMRDNIQIINSMEKNETLSDISFEKRFMTDGAACLRALDSGEADAVIIDEFAFQYIFKA